MSAYPRLSSFPAVLACALAIGMGSQAPAFAGDAYLPPSVTVSAADTSGCPQRDTPPPAIDTSEDVAPGQTTPAPLPVPEPAIGELSGATCGYLLPTDSPDLPSDISASAWLVADLDSGQILGAKDVHGRYRPASTLKLLTALTMLTNLPDLNQVVTGSNEDAQQEGSRVGIGEGGKYTVGQLLLFMMMGSGNDTAFALARANGGYDKTVADMNAQAAALGAADTRASTVSGLDGAGQMTSVYDLGLIIRAAMAHPAFPPLISTPYSTVPGFGTEPEFGIANDNKLLLNYPGALGGKTGFTDDAGNTYVGLAERDGRRLLVTMLGGSQQPRRQWMQAASLLDWGFSLAAPKVPAAVPWLGRLVNSASDGSEIDKPSLPTTPDTPGAISTDAVGVADETSSVPPSAPTAGAALPQTNPGASSWDSLRWVVATGIVVVGLGGAVMLAARRRS
ncbi:penicillin-binding protein [Nakamurella antarctica]|uniref:Penicillin-binding protein n=1 Tax=Nakamurella antarctica TaxID=1902245 RepID=A0A3G8ZY60_9ACTN|nr:D-alanyl-D-alanine carboxypeptidase [Nakamurella antarctica]AZI58591.1 penicillin-binding protein [Nakamurella antarctica]